MGAPSVAFVKQYENQITMLAQQLDSRLQGCVMVDGKWTGEEKYYDQYASDTFEELTARYQDTPVMDPDHRRRRVTPRYFVSSTLEDPTDALQMLADPKSNYMEAKRAGANRKIDDVIISALGGTAYTGKTGSTSTALGSSQQILVAGAGMTKTKLISAKKLLDAAEVEKEDRYLALTAEQLEDLLNTTEVTSSDFNTVKALVQGELETWLGFGIKHTERLLVDGSNNRLCYAFQRRGVQLAFQKTPEGRLTERADKNYAWQVYMRLALGATRMEEVRVVEIACDE